MSGIWAEIGRAVSLFVALGCLLVAYFSGNGETFHFSLVLVVLPLGCIWYGNEMGGFAGGLANEEDGGNIAGMLITVVGWIALLIMLAVIVFIALERS